MKLDTPRALPVRPILKVQGHKKGGKTSQKNEENSRTSPEKQSEELKEKLRTNVLDKQNNPSQKDNLKS